MYLLLVSLLQLIPSCVRLCWDQEACCGTVNLVRFLNFDIWSNTWTLHGRPTVPSKWTLAEVMPVERQLLAGRDASGVCVFRLIGEQRVFGKGSSCGSFSPAGFDKHAWSRSSTSPAGKKRAWLEVNINRETWKQAREWRSSLCVHSSVYLERRVD